MICLTSTSNTCQTPSLTNKPSIPSSTHRSPTPITSHNTNGTKRPHGNEKPPNPKTFRIDSLTKTAQHPRMLTWPNPPAAGRMRRTTAKTCVFPCRRPFPSHTPSENIPPPGCLAECRVTAEPAACI
ncbi:hypothetical protein K456DRAFT_263872 [Colletotrichum gloeosporioides 23]|nr:hypothetical protein K456DRAFT_263872 [Colletotrichum gloeosporioides 23]